MQKKTLYVAKAKKCKVGYENNMRDYNRLSGKTSVNRVSVYILVIIWVVDHIWFVVTLMKKVERKMRPSTNTNLERPSYSSCHVQDACFLFYVTLDFLSFHSCSCVTVITPLIQMFHVLLFKFNLKAFFAYTLFNIIH